MPIQISGKDYFTVPEVIESVGVSRQTLWRWRQDGKVPAGHRYRNRQVLFSSEEMEQLQEFANRVEPVGVDAGKQLGLFNGRG